MAFDTLMRVNIPRPRQFPDDVTVNQVGGIGLRLAGSTGAYDTTLRFLKDGWLDDRQDLRFG